MGALDPGLDRLRQDLVAEIQASERRTAGRLDGIDTRLDGIDTRLDGMDTRLGGMETGTAQRFEGLEARIEATAAETRRHFDVIAEALRSGIAVVAEGLAALDERAERFRDEVRGEFVKVDRRFLHLEARVVSALERR